ncbi:TatD family hydrolase [Candidatus Kaiserbacteria bacterium]|nr:TatD family hydrolase [Candidatus Kaiserbacteria bacterium]
MEPRYFDIHSHVTFKDYDQDLPEVLARMEENQVYTMTVGVDKKTSEEAIAFAQGKDNFFATIGLHPTDTVAETFSESEYKELVAHPKVVAVGECGVDYFRIQGDISVEKKRQWRELEKQVEFAIKYNKPLMIHCRPSKGTVDAYVEMANFLESRKKDAEEKLRGNMHFFVGNVDVARRFYSIGFTTSFTGVLTFTHDYDEVVKFAPTDMILTETDSPFAAPAPFRGRRNEPSYVKYVVEAIARIRGQETEIIQKAVLANALRVFALSKR